MTYSSALYREVKLPRECYEPRIHMVWSMQTFTGDIYFIALRNSVDCEQGVLIYYQCGRSGVSVRSCVAQTPTCQLLNTPSQSFSPSAINGYYLRGLTICWNIVNMSTEFNCMPTRPSICLSLQTFHEPQKHSNVHDNLFGRCKERLVPRSTCQHRLTLTETLTY